MQSSRLYCLMTCVLLLCFGVCRVLAGTVEVQVSQFQPLFKSFRALKARENMNRMFRYVNSYARRLYSWMLSWSTAVHHSNDV